MRHYRIVFTDDSVLYCDAESKQDAIKQGIWSLDSKDVGSTVRVKVVVWLEVKERAFYHMEDNRPDLWFAGAAGRKR